MSEAMLEVEGLKAWYGAAQILFERCRVFGIDMLTHPVSHSADALVVGNFLLLKKENTAASAEARLDSKA